MTHDNTNHSNADGVLRSALPVSIERAGEGRGRRIRGYANSFGVMRSKRIIHPQAVEDWLKENPEPRLNLLAQHGNVNDFATIGRVDVVKVDRSKGLYFEAKFAEGTDLADKAWTLVTQGMLNSLSLGWMSRKASWITENDKDLDPWFARKMKEAGVPEAYGFTGIELVEISVVDVPDDPGAKLSAKAGAALFESAIAPLRTEIAALREEVRALSACGASEAAALCKTFREQKEEFVRALVDDVIMALQTDDGLLSAAQAFREDYPDISADDDEAAYSEDIRDGCAALRKRLESFGKKR